MKMIISGICGLVLLVTGIAAESSMDGTVSGYREITILDNGVQRKKYVRLPEIRNSKLSMSSVENNTSKNISKRGIVVVFKKGKKADLEHFASTYGLKLKKKLVTGYYIFENISDEDDTVILARILKEEKGIVTLKPNWKKHNCPR
jgi:hypothetical protein